MSGWGYRALMKLAHRFHWHYAPPIYPEGDTQLWCKWCGFRQTIRRQAGDGPDPEWVTNGPFTREYFDRAKAEAPAKEKDPQE